MSNLGREIISDGIQTFQFLLCDGMRHELTVSPLGEGVIRVKIDRGHWTAHFDVQGDEADAFVEICMRAARVSKGGNGERWDPTQFSALIPRLQALDALPVGRFSSNERERGIAAIQLILDGLESQLVSRAANTKFASAPNTSAPPLRPDPDATAASSHLPTS